MIWQTTQNTAPCRTALASGRRGAGLIRPITAGYLAGHCQVASAPRGRLGAVCLGMNTVPGYFFPWATYVNPSPVGYPVSRLGPPGPAGQAPAGVPVLGEWWNVSPSPRGQPETRTNPHCSITGQVRRMCGDLNLRRQRGGTPVMCKGCGRGRGCRDEPRGQSFVKLPRSIKWKTQFYPDRLLELSWWTHRLWLPTCVDALTIFLTSGPEIFFFLPRRVQWMWRQCQKVSAWWLQVLGGETGKTWMGASEPPPPPGIGLSSSWTSPRGNQVVW